MNLNGLKYLVVGCGFWGSVLAERISSVFRGRVLILEARSHIGGNSYSSIDAASGIEHHKYGTHIFHTKSTAIWDYVQKFGTFSSYQHKVYTVHAGKVFSLPINLHTINSFFGKSMTPSQAVAFIADEIRMTTPAVVDNLEAKAISHIGRSLYEAFIKGYTKKQWGTDPRKLPAEIIARLPVRFNYNANYFTDPYQGLPIDSYGDLFKRMLSNKNIDIELGTDYYDVRHLIPNDCLVFFSGAIDRFFENKYGQLGWRSLRFERRIVETADYQGTAVMNYADEDVPYTRIHEFKHLHPESPVFDENHTLICHEYPTFFRDEFERYYPVNDPGNIKKLELYAADAKGKANYVFGGRLGTYKYWDMDKAIENALAVFDQLQEARRIGHG